MTDVAISAGARAGVNALQGIQAQMTQLQLRLATGKKVNGPTDNPAAFFTAANLSQQASTLSGLLDGITNISSTISAATKAVGSIQSLLTQAQTLANSALQSAATLVTVTGSNASTYTTGTVIASAAGSATKFKAGDTVTVSDGTTTATYTAANNDTVQTFLNAVNNTAGLKVTASLNSSGKIVLSATDAINVTIGGSVNGAGGGTLTSITGLTAGATAFNANAARSSYATQYNAILSQIDQLAGDAGFNGVNLLTGGSSTATFNSTGSSSYTVTGASATSSGLGLSAVAGSFQTDTEINAAIAKVTTALSNLQSISNSFNTADTVLSTRKDFTNSMVDFLNTASSDLVATDTNADGAALLALQTRQQVAATALSLAQNSDSTVLRLFGLS